MLDPERIDAFHDELHRELGLRRLNPWWAKAEIVIGLGAAGVATFAPPEVVSAWMIRVALFTLGLYFAMAGHRSHLYQSMNRLAAHASARAMTERKASA